MSVPTFWQRPYHCLRVICTKSPSYFNCRVSLRRLHFEIISNIKLNFSKLRCYWDYSKAGFHVKLVTKFEQIWRMKQEPCSTPSWEAIATPQSQKVHQQPENTALPTKEDNIITQIANFENDPAMILIFVPFTALGV